MATIKSHTDISQAKVLANILPLESADMYFHYDNDFGELESIPTITEEDDHFVLFPKDVRCWSLAALLEALPESYQLTSNKEGKVQLMLMYHLEKDYYNNPVDACVAMIEKLNELKIL